MPFPRLFPKYLPDLFHPACLCLAALIAPASEYFPHLSPILFPFFRLPVFMLPLRFPLLSAPAAAAFYIAALHPFIPPRIAAPFFSRIQKSHTNPLFCRATPLRASSSFRRPTALDSVLCQSRVSFFPAFFPPRARSRPLYPSAVCPRRFPFFFAKRRKTAPAHFPRTSQNRHLPAQPFWAHPAGGFSILEMPSFQQMSLTWLMQAAN